MSNYQNGKIYSIRSHQTEQIYIGSTTQSLASRLAQHRTQKNTSQIILQYPDAYIELIELFPCNTKEELNKKEGEHIRLNNCVNRCVAGRNPKEYKEDNKEQVKQKNKQWMEQNKEKHKQWREQNKEKIKQYNKKYRLETQLQSS